MWESWLLSFLFNEISIIIDSGFSTTYCFTIYSNTNMASHYYKFIGLILVKNWTKGVSRVWELENSLFYNFVNYSFSNYVKIKTPLIAVNGVLLCILTINLVWNTSIFCDTFI